ncbi:MAG: hypothetical protein ACPG80_02870 [Rickettsiales bacterium]
MEQKQMEGAQIVAAARRWVGTHFHHQGRIKAHGKEPGGCDCLGLLVGVAEELALLAKDGKGILAQFDERDYGHIPNGAHLKVQLDALLNPVALEAMQPGDILLMRFDASPQHLAIVSDYAYGGLGIIHALASARKVVEHGLDAHWRKRIVGVYRAY